MTAILRLYTDTYIGYISECLREEVVKLVVGGSQVELSVVVK